MTNQHPITPPPELVEQWHDSWIDAKVKHDGLVDFIATQAARWGADQELEACCEWLLADFHYVPVCDLIEDLHSARRPKPPSLKEQALESVKRFELGQDELSDLAVIRRALEALTND
jgi:hypothetical protein